MVETLIFVHNMTGAMLAYRDFPSAPNLAKTALPIFVANVIISTDREHPPVFRAEGLNFCYVSHSDCYLVAASRGDFNAITAFAILRGIISVLEVFLDGFTNSKKLDLNIVTVMRVLGACSSDGKVFNMDTSYLQELARPTNVYDLARGTGNIVSRKVNFHPEAEWSRSNLALRNKYDPNTIDISFVERANLVLDSTSSKPESAVIFGSIDVVAHLSDHPEVTIALTDNVNLSQLMFSTAPDCVSKRNSRAGTNMQPHALSRSGGSSPVDLCDMRLHSSVDLLEFHTARRLVFTPAEEKLRLFSYRLNKIGRSPILYSITNKSDQQRPLQREFQIKLETMYSSKIISRQIVVSIPVMPTIDSPKVQTRRGIIKYCPHEQVVKWIMESIPGKQIFKATLSFGVPSVIRNSMDQSITTVRPTVIEFDIPYYQLSALDMDSCTVGADYTPEMSVTKHSTGTIVVRHTIM